MLNERLFPCTSFPGNLVFNLIQKNGEMAKVLYLMWIKQEHPEPAPFLRGALVGTAGGKPGCAEGHPSHWGRPCKGTLEPLEAELAGNLFDKEHVRVTW